MFAKEKKKVCQRIFEPRPSTGSTSGAEDITPRQFVLALPNLLLRTGESKSFTLQAAEDAISPLPSSIPLSPVSTDSSTHSSALQSGPRTSARSIRTDSFTTPHKTLQSTVTPSPQLHRRVEAGRAARRLRFQLWNFTHPSCRLP